MLKRMTCCLMACVGLSAFGAEWILNMNPSGNTEILLGEEKIGEIRAVVFRPEWQAKQFAVIDITQEYYAKSLKYMIFGNVLRNGTYPISVSSERLFQAMAVARYAKQIGADAIAHGSTVSRQPWRHPSAAHEGEPVDGGHEIRQDRPEIGRRQYIINTGQSPLDASGV